MPVISHRADALTVSLESKIKMRFHPCAIRRQCSPAPTRSQGPFKERISENLTPDQVGQNVRFLPNFFFPWYLDWDHAQSPSALEFDIYMQSVRRRKIQYANMQVGQAKWQRETGGCIELAPLQPIFQEANYLEISQEARKTETYGTEKKMRSQTRTESLPHRFWFEARKPDCSIASCKTTRKSRSGGKMQLQSTNSGI